MADSWSKSKEFTIFMWCDLNAGLDFRSWRSCGRAENAFSSVVLPPAKLKAPTARQTVRKTRTSCQIYLRLSLCQSFWLTCLPLSTTLLWCHAPLNPPIPRPPQASPPMPILQLQLLLPSFLANCLFCSARALFSEFSAFRLSFFVCPRRSLLCVYVCGVLTMPRPPPCRPASSINIWLVVLPLESVEFSHFIVFRLVSVRHLSQALNVFPCSIFYGSLNIFIYVSAQIPISESMFVAFLFPICQHKQKAIVKRI